MLKAMHSIMVCITVFWLLSFSVQAVVLEGVVTDAETGRGLGQVQVTVVAVDGQKYLAVTDASGHFVVMDLEKQMYRLCVARIGYRKNVIPKIQIGEERLSVSVSMEQAPFVLENLDVRSVSRRLERALEAPAAVQVLDDFERPALTSVGYLRDVAGVDFARTGLNQSRVVVRGFNEGLTDRLLVLTDYRIARIPSLRSNAYQFIPTLAEDIDRIEVVSGPGSALYGPNAAGGVMHILTRSPLDAEGTTVHVEVGERDLVGGAFQHAMRLSDRVGYRVSGRYYRATDWKGFDVMEPDSIVLGVQTAQGRVDEGGVIDNRRDYGIGNVSLDGRLDFRPKENTSVVFSAGMSRASNLEYSGLGIIQMKDWTYTYLQGRLIYGDFFIQAFLNQNNAGDSFSLRSGDLFRDHSRLFVAQVQHGFALGESGLRFTYGADGLFTRPDTRHTINGRNEDEDAINELGGYVQAEVPLSDRVALIGAVRLDDHNRLKEAVVSPRGALVFRPSALHHFRWTYNRAFTTPASDAFSIDLNVSPTLGGLPYALRLRGVPNSGWTFQRDATDGLLMQSPFVGDASYMPADATLLWDVAVGVLLAEGIDLSELPPPNGDQVATVLGVLNDATFEFEPVRPDDVVNIEPLKAVINNTVEVGYKGLWGSSLFVTADVHHTRIENGRRSIMATPNVFLDAVSLTAYLEPFVGQDQAGALATVLASVPLGTVTPQEAGVQDPADLMFTDQNLDRDVSLWGIDVALNYRLNAQWQVKTQYSYLSEDYFSKEDFYVNAPKHKVSGQIEYTHAVQGWRAQMGARYVHGFPFFAGVYRGRVASYSVMDVATHIPLWFSSGTHLNVSVQNVLDNRHREFVGAPMIGRLGMLRVSHTF